jgi:hypothetical protein
LFKSEKLVGSGHWGRQTVKDILSDRVHTGDMVQGKTRTACNKKIIVPRSEWVCVQGTHEPIVSRAMFEKVQAMIAENSERDRETRGGPVPYSENVLRGKIFCAKCGNPLRRQRQNKGETYCFRCESQWRCKKDACVVVSVKESELKSEVLALLHKHSETILGRFITIEREKPGAACDAELGG